MKSLFLPLCFLTASTFASHPYIYLSGDVGIFQASINQSYIDQTDAIAQSIQQPVNQNGYTGGIAIGYRNPNYQNYFLGSELSFNVDTMNANFKAGASSTSFSDTTSVVYNIDLVFVPGINLSDTVASYLKLGISVALVRDNLDSPTGFLGTNTATNTSNRAIGFAGGIGVSKSISNRAAIFTEANYHDYGSMNFRNFQNFSTDYIHRAHIYTYNLVVGVSYKLT